MNGMPMTKINLSSAAFLVAILAVFAMGYLPALQKLAAQWDTGDNSYCYLIVPLFLYLCWEKKDTFRFGEFSWNGWGLIPVFLSISLRRRR